MSKTNERVFDERISSYLSNLMEQVEQTEGQDSKAYKALYNQYKYSSREETVQKEMNTKHYDAAVHGDVQLPNGVERLYKRQLVLDITLVCAAHCRYCLRQNYDILQFKKADIDSFVSYCSNDNNLREILITGGDPFLVPQLLMNLISQIVMKAKNIKIIRIGTRLPVQDPIRFDEELYNFFESYKKAVNFEVAIQINHKVELTPQAREIIRRLQDSGVRIYSQNVLLKGVNDDINSLIDLYDELRYLGVEAHYLFHSVPMKGTAHFRVPLKKALKLIKELTSSGNISGRIKPMLSVMTDIGKVTLYEGSMGEKDENGFYEIVTGYKLEDRLCWNPSYVLPDSARVDENGCIRVKYLDGSEEQ